MLIKSVILFSHHEVELTLSIINILKDLTFLPSKQVYLLGEWHSFDFDFAVVDCLLDELLAF